MRSLTILVLAGGARANIFSDSWGGGTPSAPAGGLVIDPVNYRSSSQGLPMAGEEKEPDLAELDEVISRAVQVGTTHPIIPQFPDASSVLQIWKGTIIEQVWPSVALSMLAPALLVLAFRSLSIPDPSHPLTIPLNAVAAGWNYQLTLSTFVVTFFGETDLLDMHTSNCVDMCLYIYMYITMYICLYLYVYVYISMYPYIYININISIYIYL